jgi:peptidyl-prolyl cis-trans isomerase C
MQKKYLLSAVCASALMLANPLMAIQNEKVYATVNGNNITSTDIAIALKGQKINFDTLPKEQQKKILEQLVQKDILSQLAVKSDVVNEKVYVDTLKATIKTLKEDLALQIWMQKLSEKITINENVLSKYYNDNKEQFLKPLELKASHILVKTKEEASKIIDKLKDSKTLKNDFSDMAKTKSIGPSGSNGGELGWFTKDKMVAEFSKAASLLGINNISLEPIKTQFGYHVIYLDDKKKSAIVSFNEAKDQIKMMLSSNKFKEKIDEILKKEISEADIKYK